MRVLVISDVPWRDDNSVGNTYSNIFESFSEVEFANLYCKAGIPDSKIVKNFYQITEKQLVLKFLGKKPKNKIINNAEVFNLKEQKFYDVLRTLRFQSFFLIRELIWKIGSWKSDELNLFLNDFKADIVFSFCLDSIYYNNLVEYCKNISKSKLVIFFADDVYAFQKMNPIYLVYKFFSRSRIIRLVKESDLVYGATPQLCKEYSKILNKEMSPLYKVCNNVLSSKLVVNQPIKIAYTGNLYYGRLETLSLIAQALKEINANGTRILLDIYTSGLTNEKMYKLLNIEGSSRLLGSVSYKKVKEILHESDIVLHVESFRKNEIKKTRLSFSTKIVDCMQSGSCLLAVGPLETASISLLNDFKIAQIISSNKVSIIKESILNLVNNTEIIKNTAIEMNNFADKYHSTQSIEKNFYIPMKILNEEIQI